MSALPDITQRSRHLNPPNAFNGTRSRLPMGAYGRLFRTLPPWEPGSCKQGLNEVAERLIRKDGRFPNEHPELPAGYTYLGAFITHDMTFEPSSIGQRQLDPDRLYNFRTPALDLDCIYGRGPIDQPYLYDPENRAKFRIGKGQSEEEPDLPRIGNVAVIGDPRNDETILLSQLHLAFLSFHNEVVKLLMQLDARRAESPLPDTAGARRPQESTTIDLFHRAQRIVRWHYQWIVIHHYLSKILAPLVFQRLLEVLKKSRATKSPDLIYYRPTTRPYIPVEFSAAAFRFGHSMVRESYQLSEGLRSDFKDLLKDTDGRLPIFSMSKPGAPNALADGSRLASGPSPEILDLRGGRRLPIGWQIDWKEFFDPGFPYPYQRAMRINTSISPRLALVPPVEGGIGKKIPMLPLLDLQKGVDMQLPSGEAVARLMGIDKVYTAQELGVGDLMIRETPLYFYILKESELQFEGLRLGSVGSEIVGEVILGLILGDYSSFPALEPNWKPWLGPIQDDFRIVDLFTFRAFDYLQRLDA